MNIETLIQDTVKKVITQLPGESTTTATPTSGNCCQGLDCQMVVIIDGVGEGLEHAIAQANTIASAGISGQIVLSRSVDQERVQFSNFQVITPGTVVELVHDCVIYIPYLSVGLAAKIANLLEDEAASRVILRGLLNQYKIFIGLSEIDLLLAGKKRLSFGLSQRIKEYRRTLKGLDLVMIKDVNQVIKACSEQGSCQCDNSSSSHQCSCPDNQVQLTQQAPLCAVGSSGCEGCGQCVELNTTGVKNMIDGGAERIGATTGVGQVDASLAGMIDHTILNPNATEDEIRTLCTEAKKYHFASVCVNPSYVDLAARLLTGSNVKVCTVIGFPLGATTTTTKAMETRDAIANGASEIDMVINVGALKSGNNSLVKKDIEAVVEAAGDRAIVKVILETALLTDEEKVRASLLSKYAGAHFVKTSTGFGPGGATLEDVTLMRKTVGSGMGVKASGGIRDLETARAMIAAGASRIGASASIKIVQGD